MDTTIYGKPVEGWQRRLYVIFFETDTRAGQRFHFWLIAAILASVLVVFLDSIESIRQQYGFWLDLCEWFFTLLFTLEYLLRLSCIQRPWRYATSFYGIVDLLAILPTYLAMLIPEGHLLIDVRILRLLRIFRIFKLASYLDESQILVRALVASRRKITVFVTSVLMLVVVLATIMYVVEGPQNGYTSIPTSIYWAIVTVTTTGYGDIAPKTPLGQAIASLVMILGYGVLAVPTGIVSAEITAQALAVRPPLTTRTCQACLSEGHDSEAVFCKQCGAQLPVYRRD